MSRRLCTLLAGLVSTVAMGMPGVALADQTGVPPGPPAQNSGGSPSAADVFHCQSFGAKAGAVVDNSSPREFAGSCVGLGS
jgi:hypothetical protein